jgi:hypothetical protein
MLDSFRKAIDEDEFRALQGRMSGKAKTPRELTEREVERIVFEDR